MNKSQLVTILQSLNACEDGVEYLKSQKSLQSAWDNCKPSYLWWIIRHSIGVTKEQSVEFANVSAKYAKFIAEQAAEWAERAAERAAEWAEWAAERAAEWAEWAEWAERAAEYNGVMTPRQYINAHWTMQDVIKALEK